LKKIVEVDVAQILTLLRIERSLAFIDNENFKRFFRFGALDQNVLLLGLLTGVGIDSIIHRRFGVAVRLPLLLVFVFLVGWSSRSFLDRDMDQLLAPE